MPEFRKNMYNDILIITDKRMNQQFFFLVKSLVSMSLDQCHLLKITEEFNLEFPPAWPFPPFWDQTGFYFCEVFYTTIESHLSCSNTMSPPSLESISKQVALLERLEWRWWIGLLQEGGSKIEAEAEGHEDGAVEGRGSASVATQCELLLDWERATSSMSNSTSLIRSAKRP